MIKKGRGISAIMYGFGFKGGLPDRLSASLELNDNKKILISTAAADVGQGSKTVATQIASDILKLEPKYFKLVEADTLNTKNAGSTSGSRQTYFISNVIKNSAENLLENIYYHASKLLSISCSEIEIKNGIIYCGSDPSRNITLWELKDKLDRKGIKLKGEGTFCPKSNLEDKNYIGYSYHTQVVDVEVDTVTGCVSVEKIFSAIDVGKAINPIGIEGQIEGGTAQGLGMALMEEQLIEKGFTVNPDMSNYIVPTALDVPEIKSSLIENMNDNSLSAVKGIGEASTIATAPAIANAIHDAIGVRFYKLPITPEKIKSALEKNKEK